MFLHFSNFLSTFFHNASMLTKIVWKNSINSQNPIILDIQQLKIHRAFSDEIIAAILLYQVNPVGIELFSLVNTLFCSNKFALYTWLNVIQARLNVRQYWPAVSTTNRMWGGLGVQQALSDFTALSQKSIILLTLLARAAVIVVFYPQPSLLSGCCFGKYLRLFPLRFSV